MSLATVRNEPTEGDNELHRLLRDSAATFAKRGGLSRTRALRATKPGLDRATWTQMAEQGWLGILVPERFGGQDLGCAEMAVVAEELARTLRCVGRRRIPVEVRACVSRSRGSELALSALLRRRW